MWSAGCILAELLIKKVLLKGISTPDQLRQISDLIGPPTKEDLYSLGLPADKTQSIIEEQEKINQKGNNTKKSLSEIFPPGTSEKGIDLLFKLLVYNPKKRLTAQEALEHEFFKEIASKEMVESRKRGESKKKTLPKSQNPSSLKTDVSYLSNSR